MHGLQKIRTEESVQTSLDERYMWVATIIMIPELLAALSQLAPPLHVKCNAVRGWICCKQKMRKYSGVMGQLHPEYRTSVWYSLTWILLLLAKCWFSYTFEIRLTVKNSATIWESMSTVQYHFSDAVTTDIAKGTRAISDWLRL
eukprot:SAG11_NODE_12819_length_683_cov_1.301370_2_plen_143_part_01